MIPRQHILFSVFLFALIGGTVSSWQAPAEPLVSRRTFLVRQMPTIAATVVVTTHQKDAVAATTAAAAKEQWAQASGTIDTLLQNWATVSKGGGDAIRVNLGTQGTTSPLFQIDKVLKVLREDAEDIVEFTEQAEEFQLALSRADSMAYSANFAGGSGKPTPPTVYIEKAKTEVVELQRIAKSLTSLI